MHIFYTANIFWQQVKVKVVEKVLVVTGLEPGTVGLLDQCSTDWATRPTIMTKGIAKLGYTLFFSIVHKTVFAWPHLTDTLQQQSGQKCENIGKMGYLGAPECIMRLNDVIRASEVSWSSWRKWPSKLPIVLPFRNSKNSLKCENVGKMGYLGALESIMRSEPQIGAPEVSPDRVGENDPVKWLLCHHSTNGKMFKNVKIFGKRVIRLLMKPLWGQNRQLEHQKCPDRVG